MVGSGARSLSPATRGHQNLYPALTKKYRPMTSKVDVKVLYVRVPIYVAANGGSLSRVVRASAEIGIGLAGLQGLGQVGRADSIAQGDVVVVQGHGEVGRA